MKIYKTKKVFFSTIILCFLVVTSSNAQEVIDQQQTQQNNFNDLLFFYLGQTFTPGVSAPLSKIEFLMACTDASGCGGENIIVNIYNIDINKKPIGSPISTTTISSFSDSDTSWRTATFTGKPTLSSGTEYAIIIPKTNNEYISYLQFPGPYANGIYLSSNDNGNTWFVINGQDMTFRLYVQNTLGVDELLTETNSFIFYQDSKTNKVTVKVYDFGVLNIYSISGRYLETLKISSKNTMSFDFSHLSKGIYILEGIFDNKRVVKKLIIS